MSKSFLITLLCCALAFTSWAQQQTVHMVKGNSVTLTAHSTNALSYLWFRDGEPIHDTFDNTLVATEAGSYTVIAINGGCESDVSDPVEVLIDNTSPTAQVDMQIRKEVDEKTAFVGDEFDYQLYIVNNSEYEATDIKVVDRLPKSLGYQRALLGYSGNVSYLADRHEILWEPETLAPGRTEELRIRVLAITDGWTDNIAEVSAKEIDPDLTNNRSIARKEIFIFKIPNVFTPNGDGLNDTFEIKGLELFPENHMMIYNRWGAQIYDSKGYQNDWTGEIQMEGTYYYIFRVKMRDNKWKVFKGPIAIIRDMTQ